MPTALRIIVAALGLLVIVASLWLRRMNSLAQTWPATGGKVLSSELKSDHDGDTYVEIRYEYTVASQTYTSERIAFAVLGNDALAKSQLIARFPVGMLVPVYYDPRNPKTSVLIRNPSDLWVWGFATGLVFTAFAVFA